MCKRFLVVILTGLLIAGCAVPTTQMGSFTMRNYVWVGKRMEHVKTPYVIDTQHGRKHVLLVGCNHTRDTSSPQFVVIQQRFRQLQPQVAFNEGGQLGPAEQYATVQEGIQRNGETGVMKYLCDRAGIQLQNGDLAEHIEFPLMLRKYRKDDLLLYYVMERLVVPYLSGAYGSQSFESLYEKAVPDWFVKSGLPLLKQEQTLGYFKALYQTKIGRLFALTLSEDIEKFDYVNGNGCYYCALGRTSKMTRDSVLLAKIDQALNKHDRVMVTFGHGHALAIEPALRQLVRRRR